MCYLFTVVGFSVYSPGGWQYPDVGEIIRVPLVMTNIGGHFDTFKNVFTCPVRGLHYFTISLYSSGLSNSEHTPAYIRRGGNRFSEVYCKHFGPDSLITQCGNSAVIPCDKGERVYVTAAYSDTQLYGSNKRNTFSGFLIQAAVPLN